VGQMHRLMGGLVQRAQAVQLRLPDALAAQIKRLVQRSLNPW